MITELQKQKRRLHARIAEAFDAVPYPGDDNLYDGWQLDDDYEDVIRRFTGKNWRDLIPKRKPPTGCSHPLEKDMSFCSPAAWHFFLPAYLIIGLMRQEISPNQFELRQFAGSGLSDHAVPRFERLSAEQCVVIVSFLDYADKLLVEKQRKMPKHRQYFEAYRHELILAAMYWDSRTIPK